MARSSIISVRTLVLVLAVAATGLTAAYATDTATYVQGEIGYVPGPVQRTRTRQEVRSGIGRNPKPSLNWNQAERRQHDEQYPVS